MSRFLWRGFEDKRKMHLINWKFISNSFDKGGLGNPDINDLNVALLSTWFYRYANERDRLYMKKSGMR